MIVKSLLLFALCSLALSMSRDDASEVKEVDARVQLPEAIIKEFGGMTRSRAERIRNELVRLLERGLYNRPVSNAMWTYFRQQDPWTSHLVTISKCFDYCFEGTPPKEFITIDIDRGTQRFMMVGRNKC